MARCEKCLHIDVCKKLIPLEYCLDKACSHFKNNADVVPRSEVEKAKQEVAREIFEELATIFKKHEKSYNNEICELLFEDLGTEIAELKKKYIGETE